MGSEQPIPKGGTDKKGSSTKKGASTKNKAGGKKGGKKR